jgi:hypothetical protein
MDWKSGSSSSRLPALQEQNPEFKSQSHQKQKRKKEKKNLEVTISLSVFKHITFT